MNTGVASLLHHVSSSPPHHGQGNDMISSEMATPTRRIERMSLKSPNSHTPLIFKDSETQPALEPAVTVDMAALMAEKGYSRRLATNVLGELNSRANEIKPSLALRKILPTKQHELRRSRYGAIHRHRFGAMESISNHYSVNQSRVSPSKLDPKYTSPVKFNNPQDNDELLGLNQKRRRTLNALEDFPKFVVPTPTSYNQSEMTRKISPSKVYTTTSHLLENPITRGLIPFSAGTRCASTGTRFPNPLARQASSDLRFMNPSQADANTPTQISPSRGFSNLHGILKGEDEEMLDALPVKEMVAKRAFEKQIPKLRYSSLQMAGVKTENEDTCNENESSDSLKPSTPSLRTSIPHKPFAKSPSRSLNLHQELLPKSGASQSDLRLLIPQLQSKLSIPQLQKQPSIPTLQSKLSIPQLQKHTSMQTLQKKPSATALQKKPSTSLLRKKSSIPQLNKLSTLTLPISGKVPLDRDLSVCSGQSLSSFAKPTSKPLHTLCKPRDTSENNTSHTVVNKSQSSSSLRSSNSGFNPNCTIPQPFSLYSKPTISSSQRSVEKFKRFKDKFN